MKLNYHHIDRYLGLAPDSVLKGHSRFAQGTICGVKNQNRLSRYKVSALSAY